MSQVVGSTAGFLGEAAGMKGASRSLQKGYTYAGEEYAKAYDKAIAEQQAAQREAMGLYQPYAQAGLAGLQQYQAELARRPERFRFEEEIPQYQFEAPSYEEVMQDPGYQFRAAAGQQAIERSAAARGGRLSGGTLADLASYQQGLASQEYQAAYGRAAQRAATQYEADLARVQEQYAQQLGQYQTGYQARQQYLAGLAGLGQMGYEAAGQQARTRALSAENLANLQVGRGGSQAEMYMGRYGAKAAQWQGVGQAFGSMSRSQGQYLGEQESQAGQTLLSAYAGGM